MSNGLRSVLGKGLNSEILSHYSGSSIISLLSLELSVDNFYSIYSFADSMPLIDLLLSFLKFEMDDLFYSS